jgi:hypothetical protein
VLRAHGSYKDVDSIPANSGVSKSSSHWEPVKPDLLIEHQSRHHLTDLRL